MKKSILLYTDKRFKDYNYKTVMKPVLHVVAAVMLKIYKKMWMVARYEKLVHMICLDKKWNISVKSKQAVKRAQDRKEKCTERLQAEKNRIANINNDEDLEESIFITESNVNELRKIYLFYTYSLNIYKLHTNFLSLQRNQVIIYTKVILICSHRLIYYITRFSEYLACLPEV